MVSKYEYFEGENERTVVVYSGQLAPNRNVSYCFLNCAQLIFCHNPDGSIKNSLK